VKNGTTVECKDRKRGPEAIIVNCMGLRAEESPQRSKATPFRLNKSNSKGGKTWYDWLPIHDMLVDEVFATIAADDKEVHWAYKVGMDRLSCCFCIMATKDDLTIAADHNPEMFARYVAAERVIDQTFLMPAKGKARSFLEEALGVTADASLVATFTEELTEKQAGMVGRNIKDTVPKAAPADEFMCPRMAA